MAVYDLEEQDQIEDLKAWWAHYGTYVTAAVTTVAVVVIGVQGWRWYQHSQAEQASMLYSAISTAATHTTGMAITSSAVASTWPVTGTTIPHTTSSGAPARAITAIGVSPDAARAAIGAALPTGEGLFAFDSPDSAAYSQQTNVLAVLADAVPIAAQRGLMERARSEAGVNRGEAAEYALVSGELFEAGARICVVANREQEE